MKQLFFVTLLLVLTGRAMAAEGESVLTLPDIPSGQMIGYATRGTRVAAIFPILNSTSVAPDATGNHRLATSLKMQNPVGLGIGYISLPVRRTGWETTLNATSLRSEMGDLYAIRATGNLCLAFTSKFYAKSGVNISDLVGKTLINGQSATVRPGPGLQTGAGYQLSKNVGVDLAYVWTTQSHSLGGQIFQEGLEMGVTGTF